eukprot:COSAG02_NODE_70_length_42239_cov_15.323090_12_plen_62_part_00
MSIQVGADALQLARQSISDEKVLAEMEVVLTGEAQASSDDAPAGATNCSLAHNHSLCAAHS